MRIMSKSYSEMLQYKKHIDRFNYLKLNGSVGFETFGVNRLVNQRFYKSDIWLRVRDKVIIRDDGCDLGVDGFEIYNKIIVHHIEPITLEDILNMESKVLDLDNLVTTSHATHNAIHYGDETTINTTMVERQPNDTKLW